MSGRGKGEAFALQKNNLHNKFSSTQIINNDWRQSRVQDILPAIIFRKLLRSPRTLRVREQLELKSNVLEKKGNCYFCYRLNQTASLRLSKTTVFNLLILSIKRLSFIEDCKISTIDWIWSHTIDVEWTFETSRYYKTLWLLF